METKTSEQLVTVAPRNVAIVGGGVTAHRCAFRLRQLGYEGRIQVFCGETLPPYDRTALSKSALSAAASSPVGLSPDSAYESAGIELKLGATVAEVRPTAKRIVCEDGSEHGYDKALIATGAQAMLPRPLRAPGVHTLRTKEDLPALIAATFAARSIAIVGGGLIGCELASSLSGAGSSAITLIEAEPGPLYRIAGEDVAQYLLEEHQAAGVHVLTNSTVGDLRMTTDRRYEIQLGDGTSISADCVVVAIGARPACQWLSGSGVTLDDGVITDEYCQTGVPDVFAAGDCARFPSRRSGGVIRLEHWDSAARHGVVAAENMLGERTAFDPVPFFWSDQHTLKLAMAGLPNGDERLAVDRCDDSVLVTFDGPAGPTAGLGINRTKEVVELRRRLEGGTT